MNHPQAMLIDNLYEEKEEIMLISVIRLGITDQGLGYVPQNYACNNLVDIYRQSDMHVTLYYIFLSFRPR